MVYVMYGGELYHHGILGQKWGVRRFQNKDGSLTSAGVKRYGEGVGSNTTKSSGSKRITDKGAKKELTPEERAARNAKMKKVAIAIGTTAAVAALAYGGHKYLKHVNDSAEKKLGNALVDQIMESYEANAERKDFSQRLYNNGQFNNHELARRIGSSERQHIEEGKALKAAAKQQHVNKAAKRAVVREDINYAKDRMRANRMGYGKTRLDRSKYEKNAETYIGEYLRNASGVDNRKKKG